MTAHLSSHCCPACGASESESGIDYRNAHWPRAAIFRDLSMALCRECGMGYVTPDVPEDGLHSFYAGTYRAKGNRDYINPAIIQFHRWGVPARQLAQIMLGFQYAPLDPGDRFIDIGAGDGAALDVVRKLSPGSQLCAVEPSEDVRHMFERIFQGIVVYPTYQDAFCGENRFKMVLMSHSLEHFNPGSIGPVISRIASALDDRGVLVIEVPHVDLRMKEFANRSNDAPHLCFFSVAALKLVLERAGLDVLFIDTCDRTVAPAGGQSASGATPKSRTEASARARLSGIVPPAMWRVASRLRHPVVEAAALIRHGDPVIRWANTATTRYGGTRSCLRAVARNRPSRPPGSQAFGSA